MLLSDIAGLIGSIALTIAPGKDQVYRLLIWRQERRATDSPWPKGRRAISKGWKAKKDGFSAFDSFTMLLGALGLITAFVMKMFGM